MLHKHDGDFTLRLDIEDEAHHVLLLLDVHPRHGFVEQKKIRAQRQGPGHLDAFLNPVAETAHRPLAVGFEFHKVDHVLDVGAVLGFQARGASVIDQRLQKIVFKILVAGQEQIVQHRHAAEKLDILKRPGDAEVGDLVRRGLSQAPLPVIDVAPGQMIESGDAVEQAGLAGAVGSDDRGDQTRIDGHVHAGQGA